MEFSEKSKLNEAYFHNGKDKDPLLEEYARLKYDFFHNKLDSSKIQRYKELKKRFDIIKLNQVKEDIKKRLIELNKTTSDDNAMYTAMTQFKEGSVNE